MTKNNHAEPRKKPKIQGATSGVTGMFQSARFKLTVFYLVIIVFFSLSMSYTMRWLAQREYEHNNVAQLGEFRGVVTKIYGLSLPQTNDDVFDFQVRQEAAVRDRLSAYMIIINLGAFVVGGFVSYWYAGRTLRPIKEAHEAQKRFASDASHELRTPLTVIRAENEIFLRQKEFTQADAHELIRSNLEEVDRLERLSSNLLAMTQYESAVLQLEPVKLHTLVTEAIRQMQRTHTTAAATSTVSKKLSIICHKESFVQLLHLVLDNAYKYGGEGVIEVGASEHDKHVLVTVRDHGSGILPTDLPFIFDRLYRGDKARSNAVSGHGLGLALAQQIARANNASIAAANHPEGGAVFTIIVPVKH